MLVLGVGALTAPAQASQWSAPVRPPVGCRFRDRCSLATARCVEEPPFVDVGDGHTAACWYADTEVSAETPLESAGAR